MPRQISTAARTNHQNCVGSISARIIIIPHAMAIVANRKTGPLRKKPPPAQAFCKTLCGRRSEYTFIILFAFPELVLGAELIQTYV